MSEEPSNIRVSVLGPLTVEREGQPVGLGGPRQRLVLALLVQAAPSVVSADRLIADVWGDEAPASPKGTLQTYISQLRSALGGSIVTRGTGYALDVPGETIDAVRFEDLVGEARRLLESRPGKTGELLREALALWRGRPYADLIDQPALRAEITRLEELRVGAVEDRVAADLAVGAHSELVAELEVLTAEHPLRERFRAQQMLALYRAGRQADALRAYQRTRDVLVEELGIDPSPKLQDLEDRILRQDPTLLEDLEPHVERLVVLITDIEDSTVLWELHPDQMPTLLAEHDRILNELITSNGGRVFKTTGDGVCSVFDGIVEAATAVVAIQLSLAGIDRGEIEQLAMRCALDIGDVEARAGDYFGPVLNRCARLLAAGHGGQILLSADAQAALVGSGEAGWSTRTLGEFRFKGLGRPQQVFQMQAEGLPDGFPPLRIDRLPPPLPGTAFGRSVRGYELRERIGGGDFGIVYRAYQPTVGREVAVKVIRPEFVDQPAFVRQFEAEAQLVAGLEHPHIVSLYDYWRDPDGAYLVMQWLRGGSLRRALDRGPFNAEAALRLLDQICGALGYAHRQGVAHRDLKPGNVLLDEEGNAFLTDFGIAVRLVDASEGRRPQSTSPAYVPPEEIRGEPVTVASDIYCLGLLTFELLTGRQPPMDGALPSIETIRPDLPAPLSCVIAKAIAEDPGDRHSSVSEFLADVRAGFGEAVIEETVPFTPTRNPYKGLRPFIEADAADFYGRDQLIADLVAAVADHRLVAVVGPSGLGKSSVVRAGFIPALRAGAVPGSRQWLITTMFPGSHPFEELEAALARIAEEWPAHAGNDLRQDNRGLVRVSKQIIPDHTILLLVIDQFEELFTLTRDEATRQLFLDNLAELVADERSRIRVVVTLRADHFDRPLRYPNFAKLIRQGLVTVSGLTDQELTDAITKPAHGVGLNTEPGLEKHILADIHNQPAALPLLQYALTELFAGRHSDTLTIAGYTQTGGLLGALSHRAEDLYTRLDEPGRQMARQVFLRLVNVSEERQDTRRRVRRRELEGITRDPTTLDRILQTYGEHRLLSFDRDPESREPTVEVAHEALLSEWERLRTWIDDRRDDLVLHRRLIAAVDEWRASGKRTEYLLTGGRLDHFESFAGQTDLAIGAGESSYLAESRRHSDELATSRRRRRRGIMAGFAAAAVIAAVLAVGANQQRGRAEVEASLNRSRVLAAASIDAIGEDNQLALLLGLEAADLSLQANSEVLPEVADALHRSLRASRLEASVSLDSLPVGRTVKLAASPSGLVAVSSTGDTVELRHGDDIGTVVATLGVPVEGADVGLQSAPAFAPDGASVAVVGSDGTVRVWDVESGTEIWSQPRRSPGRGGVVYSPDGARLLSAAFTTVVMWDATSGEEIWAADFEGGQEALPAFSPDGTRIGVGGWGSADLTVLDAASGEDLAKFDTGSSVGSLVWSPDGSQLFAGLQNGDILVVDSAALAVVDTWEGHSSTPWSVAIDSAGTRLATGADDGTVRIWDLATGGELMVLGAGAGSIDGVAFLPGDRHLVATGNDRVLRLYDVSPQGRGEVFAAYPGGETAGIDFSPDGTKLISLSALGEWNPAGLTIWDVATGSPLLTIDGLDWFSFDGVAFTNDGTGLVVQEWDEDQEPTDTVGEGWGPVQLRDATTGGVLMSFAETEGQERQTPGFSADGRVFAVGSTASFADFENDERMSTASVHDAATGELLHRLDHEDWAVSAVALSPNGDRLATATCDRGIVTVWEVATETILWSTEYPGCSTGIAFSPDGSFIAASSLHQPPAVWDAATGEKRFDIVGHNGGAFSIEISPDGSTVASAGTDGTALVVDAGTGEPLISIQVADVLVGDVDFSPDGATLAAAAHDGSLYVFALDSERLLDLARTRTLRTLTEAECATYDIDPCPASQGS